MPQSSTCDIAKGGSHVRKKAEVTAEEEEIARKEPSEQVEGAGPSDQDPSEIMPGSKRHASDISKVETLVADASLARLERKRYQEKRRRQEFRAALENLLATLVTHDSDFHDEALVREATRAAGRVSNSILQSPTTPEGDNALFNRVELINQAIFTISRTLRENEGLAQQVIDLQAGREPTPLKDSLKAVFHHGVGPLTDDSADKTALVTANQTTATRPDAQAISVPPVAGKHLAERRVFEATLRQHNLLFLSHQLQVEGHRRQLAAQHSAMEFQQQLLANRNNAHTQSSLVARHLASQQRQAQLSAAAAVGHHPQFFFGILPRSREVPSSRLGITPDRPDSIGSTTNLLLPANNNDPTQNLESTTYHADDARQH